MSDAGYIPKPPLARIRDAVRERGAAPVAVDLAQWGGRWLAGAPWSLGNAGREFAFQGESYPYLFHRYKHSWLTERAVEVPIVRAIVERHAGQRILEVGNVLAHYWHHDHVVVDKYERAPGVVNRDVLELDDLGPFDLVVAISTLEHVGVDELPRDPEKAIRATLALRGQVAPGGQLVMTVPIGYNSALDAALRDRVIPLRASAAMRRVAETRLWREVPTGEVWSAPYDWLLLSAHGVLFAFVDIPSA